MSGVEAAIAIVSCVAGLIQALDSGTRIVKQIKARRQAHRADGALPPHDALEKTIEHRKQQIQQLVTDGSDRFGPGFAEGDDAARLALLQITVQIQNTLLDRLTQARSDDGVVDFDECIDLSDKGCTDALLALQALYQRKLEQDMAQKQQYRTQQDPPAGYEQNTTRKITQKQQTTSEPIPTMQRVQSAPANEIHTLRPIQTLNTSNTPQKERKKSGLRYVLRSPKTQDATTKANNLIPFANFPNPPPCERRATTPAVITTVNRQDTLISETSDLSAQSTRASRGSMSSDGATSFSSPTRKQTWTPEMSRASTMATLIPRSSQPPNPAVIAKYGGFCKYAYQIRESGLKGGLQLVTLGRYGSSCMYQCKSTHCKFQCRPVPGKRGSWEMDKGTHTSHGIEFRLLFLAKSHVATEESTGPQPYLCLVCSMIKHDSDTYYGVNSLFEHIATHREKTVGDVPLEGPISFNNHGAQVNEDFDINLPEHETDSVSMPKTPESKQEPIAKMVGCVQDKLERYRIQKQQEDDDLVAVGKQVEVNDPYYCPW